jgi:hypothetical protein
MAHHKSMGRRRPGNPIPKGQQFNRGFSGNEEIKYPVPDPNRTMINNTNKLGDAHKKNLSKRILWKRSLRNSWRSCKTWLIRKYKCTQEMSRHCK